ncbi:MAG: DUF2214 domain-containing protein [Kiloniellaceae bacterium]
MLAELLTALQNLEPVAALRASRWVYPLVNAGHIAGIALLVGAIVPLDLRLLGAWRSVPLDLLARVLQPVAVAGLALAVLCGFLMFAVSAGKYAGLPLFWLKLGFIAAALANAALLRLSPAWTLARLPGLPPEPPAARLKAAGALSIALWLAALLCGRFLAYIA